MRCNSLEEIKALREAHDAFRSSLSSAQADFNQLAELDRQIKSFRVASNPYTWFTMEALEETWRNLQKIIKVHLAGKSLSSPPPCSLLPAPCLRAAAHWVSFSRTSVPLHFEVPLAFPQGRATFMLSPCEASSREPAEGSSTCLPFCLRSGNWSCRRSSGGRRRMTSCARSLLSTPMPSTSGSRRPGACRGAPREHPPPSARGHTACLKPDT